MPRLPHDRVRFCTQDASCRSWHIKRMLLGAKAGPPPPPDAGPRRPGRPSRQLYRNAPEHALESDFLTPLTCRPPAGPGSISSQSCPFSFAARPKLVSDHDSLPAAASTTASTPCRFCQGCQVSAQGARRQGLGLLCKPVPAVPACRATAPTRPLTFYSGPKTFQYCPLSRLEPALGALHPDGRLPALQIRRRERTGRRSKGGGGRREGGG